MMAESPAILEARRLRELGAQIGKGTLIFGRVDVSSTHSGLIKIGECCLIASEAMILSHGYPSDWLPVVIGNYCYIGLRSLIVPGVVILDNCVVGAGAVVPKTLKAPEWSLIVGNPAVAKKLDREKHKRFCEHMNQFINLT